MGKTYVALAAVASVLNSTRGSGRPVIVMMPPGLASKWPRDWEQFRSLCVSKQDALNWVRTAFVKSPAEFFKMIDDPRGRRPHLIWMTTGCFHMGLNDPWIKLAFIRLARAQTRLSDSAKGRLFKWAKSLIRLKSHQSLIEEDIEWLLTRRLSKWHRYLKRFDIVSSDSDDPVPTELLRQAKKLAFDDWTEGGGKMDRAGLATLLGDGTIPGKTGRVSSSTESEARQLINDACQHTYWQWLRLANWRASLLVLDEAHHAKNDNTRLATLFRSEDTSRLLANDKQFDYPLLFNKFDRMLFLTATPFQLGHQELIRVLRSFGAARWVGSHRPAGTREEFFNAMDSLEKRLDENRLAGRRLDQLWGRLTWEQILGNGERAPELESAVSTWWRRVQVQPALPLEREVLGAVEDCRNTKRTAEADTETPRCSLKPWVIRHNRPVTLPKQEGKHDEVPRRKYIHGNAIAEDADSAQSDSSGLSLIGDTATPFLLAARAQGELATGSEKARAYFAEGLCSSYEAFHHTRDQRGDVRDVDDDGIEIQKRSRREAYRIASIVPIKWYENQIRWMIPSKAAPEQECYEHPKIKAVVSRTVRLWQDGEKVLIFCFYRETARALRAHVGREVEAAILRQAAVKLGIDSNRSPEYTRNWLQRISGRLADEKSPFHEAVVERLKDLVFTPEFSIIKNSGNELVELLAAYVRSPSFISRYLPINVPEVRDALSERESRPRIIEAGVTALRSTLEEQTDGSGMTMLRRVTEFLRFAKELAELSQQNVAVEDSGENVDLLQEYVDAIAVYISPRRHGDDDDEEGKPPPTGEGTYRVLPTVRMVYGDTKREVRERLMLAFNSPLFPEILISSSVLGEGVDLHRFCRYVIHHDLCWNPSTLEQRTGRLDRIRCKAETVSNPIVVFEPFIAGSADEKMFRVVRDRERWFQIVMGQKFNFDERTSDELAKRVPLPLEIASEIVFNLSRYIPSGEVRGQETAQPELEEKG